MWPQLTVPLFSANQVIGVIILESEREGELDLLDLDFVARLAEHASPAITNSQLFRELERANEDKSKFVSLVAHELKNPMTSMKGYTDLLIKGVVGPVNEQQDDFLKTIFNNVNRMETLVSDLNDLTKQQTGNLRLEIMAVDFRNVVIETLRAQQRQIEDKQQELIVEVPENLPLVHRRSKPSDPDHDQLRLQRAQIYAARRHDHHPRRTRAQRVGPARRAARAALLRQDTGIGMSEDDLHELFTPYFRATEAREMRHRDRPRPDDYPRFDRAARRHRVGRERDQRGHDVPFHDSRCDRDRTRRRPRGGVDKRLAVSLLYLTPLSSTSSGRGWSALGGYRPLIYPTPGPLPSQAGYTLPTNRGERMLTLTPGPLSRRAGEGERTIRKSPRPLDGRGDLGVRASIRLPYLEIEMHKGLFTSPLSGLPVFFHSCPVSTGSDANRNATSQMVAEDQNPRGKK